MYNLTILQNSETVLDLFTFANICTTEILGILMILAIFFIMLMQYKKWGFENAILSASFICFILGSLLTYAKMLNLIFPLGFLIIMALSAFYVYVVQR